MNDFLRVVIFQAGLLFVQTILYLGIQKFEGPAHDMKRDIDNKIPLVPQWIFIYVLWFPLIAIFPLGLYWWNVSVYKLYIAAVLVDLVISLTIYMAYPTSFERPKPPTDSFGGKALSLMYVADYKGKNCMPSLHCSMCYIIIVTSFMCTPMPLVLRLAACTLSVLIVCATVLTKQHVLVDMIAAVPVAVISCIAGYLIVI